MSERERMVALLSWWAGWCTDHEETLPELTRLKGDLLDAKHLIAVDGYDYP